VNPDNLRPWKRGGGAAVAMLIAVVCVGVCGCGRARVSAPRPDVGNATRLRAALVSTSGAASTDAADAAPVGTGWGGLTGRFVYAGTPGDPQSLVVDKDLEVCGRGGMKLYDRSLLVDSSTKGLANVVVFARNARRVKDPVPETPLVFDQKNCEFLSPVFAARVGRPVDVRNSDPIGHNTNVAGTSFNQLIPADGSTTYRPSAETGVPTMVTCNIHPWMKAYAVFRKDGYVAVTAADGSFTIPDLPAGEAIEFQVWHERAGAVGLAKPDLKWSPKGRFTITIEEGQTRDIGTIEVPAGMLGS
jgi:hypothetical protein